MSMMGKLPRYFRILRTGTAFAVFGVGGLVFAAAIPVLSLVSRDHAKRVTRVRTAVRRLLCLFVRIMKLLGLIRVSWSGLEKLDTDEPFVMLANHPTLIDVVLLLSQLPPVECIVKEDLWRNFFLRGIVRGADYIPNTDGVRVVDKCVERLESGNSVVIFPEGTRSMPDGLRPFQRGAAGVIQRSKQRVLPILITCSPPTLSKGQKWYDVPDRPVQFDLRILDPIDTISLLPKCSNLPVLRRRLTAMLGSFFEEQLEHVRAGTRAQGVHYSDPGSGGVHT